MTISSVISTEDTLVNGNSGEDMWVSPSHNYFLNWKGQHSSKNVFSILLPPVSSLFYLLSHTKPFVFAWSINHGEDLKSWLKPDTHVCPIFLPSAVKKEMSQNLLQWSVADVASYFSAAGFPEQAVAFKTQVSATKLLLHRGCHSKVVPKIKIRIKLFSNACILMALPFGEFSNVKSRVVSSETHNLPHHCHMIKKEVYFD